jgi:hypothetical protein
MEGTQMARLTKKEKELICTMCNIAESNGDVAEMNDGHGQGDYEGWTREDFERADAIYSKLVNYKEFAERIKDSTGDAGMAARAVLAGGR